RQVIARERNPEVDGNPLPLTLVAEPIEGEVHADFARAAERREHQLLPPYCHYPSPPSAPFPKFVIHLSTLRNELRKQRGTRNSMILVPLFDLKFLGEFAAGGVGTSNRR